jgi:cold shock CspA family protein
MMQGHIKSWNKRGFCFIKPDMAVGNDDLFAHAKEFQNIEFDDVKVGARVIYEEGVGRDGRPKAVQVQVV